MRIQNLLFAQHFMFIIFPVISSSQSLVSISNSFIDSTESNYIQNDTLSHKLHNFDLHHWEIPSKDPDRIILNFNGDPSSRRAVTWRTDSSVKKSFAQIALASANSNFTNNLITLSASIEEFDLGIYKSNKSLIVNYHSVVFDGLNPNSIYVYRVGNGENWSEWIQFKTAKREYSPFQFVYFGDAQNDILNHWSRVIRKAYQTAPNASFVIHAGDLVDSAHRDYEWAQWFKAGGFIHSQWTAIPVVGNHEFQKTTKSSPRKLSIQWRPQFTLPIEENLSNKLHETVYTVNYQDVLILVLNSTDNLDEQTEYIKDKLGNSDARWKIVTSHHSVFSPAKGRDFEYARKYWKPLFDKYGVDLVLNGHDHLYARGHVPIMTTDVDKSGKINTLYITSVSGPKQYKADIQKINDYKSDGYEVDILKEETQFFQVISVNNDKLTYVAYTALGDEYDKAVILKDFTSGDKYLK